LRKEGVKAGLLRLKTLWPFPEEAVREVAQSVKRVVVPEMNRGQVAGEVRKACLCDVISVGQTNGEIIRPETILQVMRKVS
jgi:2-oxoglutarate ferredoxin oxidoreductase subunit alpha